MERLNYHFEPEKGWINDPNGLVYFKGRYHAFFQHYPYDTKWGPMHWGHAVSQDMVHWEELPVALYPDMPYENDGGCFSGSAVVKDDVLYLFYTSVSKEMGQTQSVAISEEGVHFKKYEKNPVIRKRPFEESPDFRDPKVIKGKDSYYMVCGAGLGDCGKVVLYTSENLLDWEYAGVLLEGREYGPVIECPDLFPCGDSYVLMISMVEANPVATVYITGEFDGKTFTPLSKQIVEMGPDYYAPQTFMDHNGRRIAIGWLYHWGKQVSEGVNYAGALTIPREITVTDGRVRNFPVREAGHLLTAEDEHIKIEGNRIRLFADSGLIAEYELDRIDDVKILRDTKTIEVFVNYGEFSASFWYKG